MLQALPLYFPGELSPSSLAFTKPLCLRFCTSNPGAMAVAHQLASHSEQLSVLPFAAHGGTAEAPSAADDDGEDRAASTPAAIRRIHLAGTPSFNRRRLSFGRGRRQGAGDHSPRQSEPSPTVGTRGARGGEVGVQSHLSGPRTYNVPGTTPDSPGSSAVAPLSFGAPPLR